MEESSDKDSVDFLKTSDQSFPNLGTSEIHFLSMVDVRKVFTIHIMILVSGL